MNYELAVKLKLAGFPQDLHHIEEGGWVEGSDNTLVPTFTELIDACNPFKSDDFGIKTDCDRWHAWYDYDGYFEHNKKFEGADGMFSVHQNVFGSTPEEAIASLWLALHEKPV